MHTLLFYQSSPKLEPWALLGNPICTWWIVNYITQAGEDDTSYKCWASRCAHKFTIQNEDRGIGKMVEDSLAHHICISEPSWFYNFHVCSVVHGNLNFSSLIIPSSLSLYLFLSAVFCLLAHWFKVSFFTLFAILQTNCYFVLLGKSNFCVFYFN